MPTKHILLSSVPAWGHVRPILSLAARLVMERDDIVLTILLPPSVLDKAHEDIKHQLHGSSFESAVKRIRILATFVSDSTDLLNILAQSAESYAPTYKALIAGNPVTCAVRGTVFAGVPAPVAIIIDFFSLGELRATRAITGLSVPVIAFIPSSAAPTIKIVGPESMGGPGNVAARVDEEVARTGRGRMEVAEELYLPKNGMVMRIPGMPEMHDYEAYPQIMPPIPMSALLRATYSVTQEAEGLIVPTCNAYENSGSLEALKTHREKAMKSTFSIGPLLPIQYEPRGLSNCGDWDVELFLADNLVKYGKKSVMFISFGTITWPHSSDNIEEVIECLIEKNMPFILCHASPAANLSEALVAKVEASGLGCLSKWAPQQYILTHPATGWYLTHCGWGGISEALGAGIPMICWPFMVDQPYNAAHLSENLKVAIELVEVRSGEPGTKPMRRNGRAAKGTRAAVREEFRRVVDEIRGETGAELRANAERVRRGFVRSWEDGGDGKAELQALLNKYVLAV